MSDYSPMTPDKTSEARTAVLGICPCCNNTKFHGDKCPVIAVQKAARKAAFEEAARVFKNHNLAYIVIFLRNGGEKLRAIWLSHKALNITISEAKDWVETVKLDRVLLSGEDVRKRYAEAPWGASDGELEDYYEYQVSHWPESIRALAEKE